MKCIRCDNDCKYKERSDKRCPKCHGFFAFEPKAGDKLTDSAFKSALDAVSANGSVRWGVEHLYYEVCRRIRKRGGIVGWGCLIAVLFLPISSFIAIVTKGNPQIAVPIVGGLFVTALVSLLGFHFMNREYVPIDVNSFNKMWSRWREIHGVPTGLIVRQEQPAAPKALESDIGDYSFDRAVICDRARTVDLLLANNFHFENNCAVLSIEGYPQGPFEIVRKMLKRNPKLQAFALHDASPAGCKLAHRLQTSQNWFADGVRVVDVGLSPYQSKRFRGLFLKAARHTAATFSGISARDKRWLSRYTLELAAIRPDQVIKRLFRAINQTKGNASMDDGEATMTTGGSGGSDGDFSSDASDSDGTFDSFG